MALVTTSPDITSELTYSPYLTGLTRLRKPKALASWIFSKIKLYGIVGDAFTCLEECELYFWYSLNVFSRKQPLIQCYDMTNEI